MREQELTQDQSDRLAEALIDEVITEALDERRSAVDRCREDLAVAQRALATSQHDLNAMRRTRQDWRRRRALDYAFGGRVLMQARLADFTAAVAPPGTHVRAVGMYFESHPPTLALKRLERRPRRWGIVRRRR